jgi:hypothetical protein
MPSEEALAAQMQSLPGMFIELLEACTDHGATAVEETGARRSSNTDPLAAPIELNLTILDFLAEPNLEGRLGMVESMLAMAAVTRQALGGVEPEPYDRIVAGNRMLRRLGLNPRISLLSKEQLIEVATFAAAVAYLVAQSGRIIDAKHWTRAAAAGVGDMFDNATVGIDDRLHDRWQEHRRTSQIQLDELQALVDSGVEVEAWLLAGYSRGASISEPEYIGWHLDAIRKTYAAAAAGPEQWSDFLAEEVARLHDRAEALLGQTEQRSHIFDDAPCPFCDSYGLTVVIKPPSERCRRSAEAAIARGYPPPPDRCCGEFVQCVSCGRSWSLAVDPETMRSEATATFAAFRESGWSPAHRDPLRRLEHGAA